ncbi:hypothetical protein [Candidatus Uabimicrobium sp. HlEnr_7]|uniref:hypothetical protein n=1 Tax=Candidatus Uabimicrobium helgolandensis TaxID=3095367 RepID=UPI003556ABE6
MNRRKNKQIQTKKFQKWCKRVCQRIRSCYSFTTKASLQLHFLKNPQKNQPGICIEYTTERVFSIDSNGYVDEIGRIFVEGDNEDIILNIVRDDYDLL